jgi:hypothetical protein
MVMHPMCIILLSANCIDGLGLILKLLFDKAVANNNIRSCSEVKCRASIKKVLDKGYPHRSSYTKVGSYER